MTMEVGSVLINMGEAWWSPAFINPTIEYEGKAYNQIDSSARTKANSIIVNKQGKRFANKVQLRWTSQNHSMNIIKQHKHIQTSHQYG